VHRKHHTDKQNSSQLHYVSVTAIHLLSNKTSFMAIPLFTVSLNNYTFFLKNLIMGSRLKIVILLYDASTTFNVAVQYLQCKHLVTFTWSQVSIIHENSYFPHQQQWKVDLRIIHKCVLSARFYGMIKI